MRGGKCLILLAVRRLLSFFPLAFKLCSSPYNFFHCFRCESFQRTRNVVTFKPCACPIPGSQPMHSSFLQVKNPADVWVVPSFLLRFILFSLWQSCSLSLSLSLSVYFSLYVSCSLFGTDLTWCRVWPQASRECQAMNVKVTHPVTSRNQPCCSLHEVRLAFVLIPCPCVAAPSRQHVAIEAGVCCPMCCSTFSWYARTSERCNGRMMDKWKALPSKWISDPKHWCPAGWCGSHRNHEHNGNDNANVEVMLHFYFRYLA